jgi:predicted GNAT family acetyltransferase
MNIKQDHTNGRFFIEEDNKQLGELVYREKDSLMTIDHTEVSDKLKGKGAGKQLVTAAVDYARKNNLKIYPTCSFAKSVFERVVDFQDVLQRK